MEAIEVPVLKQAAELMNNYIGVVQRSPPQLYRPTPADEQSMIYVLTGIAGLVEYNVRIAFQRFSRRAKLAKDNYFGYGELLDAFSPHIQLESHRELLKASSRIRNKLLHADFPELYKKTKAAYEITGVEFHQNSFEPLAYIVETTLTRHGVNIDVESGKTVDNRGQTVPSKLLIPGAGDSISVDFQYFYRCGHFLHVYDVLRTTYESVVFLRYEV